MTGGAAKLGPVGAGGGGMASADRHGGMVTPKVSA
jgi:hypothetical protein